MGPAMMRVLITGSRGWTHLAAVRADLDSLLSKHGRDGLTIVHGACSRGADRMAANWARQRKVTVEAHPADWERYGRARAGFIRNAEMVQAGADLCLAYVLPCESPNCPRPRPHDTHGSADCIARAEAAGIPLRIERSSW
jgi:YspA, cpYpsA-related SLOG family